MSSTCLLLNPFRWATPTRSPIRFPTPSWTPCSQDPNSRVACETMVSTGMAVVAGEVHRGVRRDPDIVRRD